MTQSNSIPLTPIADALQQLMQSLPVLEGTESVNISELSGRVLTENIIAPVSVPNCANSAMDGYAVRTADIDDVPATLKVSQRITAGKTGSQLDPGEAARIFTGAPLPPGADAVVMQENAVANGAEVIIQQAPCAGENSRPAGEDVEQGETLFEAGHRFRPQDVGVIASAGLTTASVRRKLKAAIFTTGDELVTPGTSLELGQIYNSNLFSLTSLLQNLQVEVLNLGVVKDDFEMTKATLKQAADSADCVITTGGVSVGEEDHVKAAVAATGNLDLWKLAIKPGKPFASGKVRGKQFFGLPGNPVSAFVTFVLIVRPMVMTMLGCQSVRPTGLPVMAGFDAQQSGERQEYIRVTLESNDGNTVLMPFRTQSSGVGASLSAADGLAIIPPDTAVNQGDTLMYLPFSELLY